MMSTLRIYSLTMFVYNTHIIYMCYIYVICYIYITYNIYVNIFIMLYVISLELSHLTYKRWYLLIAFVHFSFHLPPAAHW